MGGFGAPSVSPDYPSFPPLEITDSPDYRALGGVLI